MEGTIMARPQKVVEKEEMWEMFCDSLMVTMQYLADDARMTKGAQKLWETL